MSEQDNWSERRRACSKPRDSADAAIALCAEHLKSGEVLWASRSALLAQRLIRLEAAQAERQMKRDVKDAIARSRAEAALAEARKAVASFGQ